MSDLTPKGFSRGQYVDRFLLRDKLYAEDAITMKGVAILNEFPAADVEPVRHAYWVKRIEHGVGRGYEVYTPIWSCSDCGRDYNPASCSSIKYCYICGAKMDGGQDE